MVIGRRSQKIWGLWSPSPAIGAVADLLKRHPSPCVTMPNVVTLGQTIWAYIWGPKILEAAGPRPLVIGSGSPRRNMTSPFYIAIFGNSS